MSDYAKTSNPSTRQKNGVLAVFAAFTVCIIICVCVALFFTRYLRENKPVYDDEFAAVAETFAIIVNDSDISVIRAEEIVSTMSLEEKVGQLFMVRSRNDSDIFDVIHQTHAGGVILFANDLKEKDSAQVLDMVNQMQASSDGRMLVAVDEEGGTVVRVSSNPKLRAGKFQSPRELYAEGGLARIVSDTDEKCTLLKSLGINMNMAPVADVCTNRSGFMYRRAFSGDARATAQYVSTVVDTMKRNSVASCVKHFPGYGNSTADTHKGLDVNTKSAEELRENDLLPFAEAIAHGADGIMLTHTIIKAIDAERPASLSPDVVNLIRSEMGFDGVIVSDGLEMGAVIEYSGDSAKVCIMAVSAGVDILCVPKDPIEDYKAVLAAVSAGDIPESRIDEAVTRIVKLKIKLGLYESR